MINKITVKNHRNEKMEIDLRRPNRTGFLIYDITGVGPGKATINTAEYSINDGGIHKLSKLGPRNIVLYVKFMFTPTIEAVRQKSYQYFPIKREIKLTFETDNRIAEITGYVEANEPVMFGKDAHTQISIICPDPYFYSKGVQVTDFHVADPLFEFEYSNEGVDIPVTEFGDILTNAERSMWYSGDAEVGAKFFIVATGPATNISILNAYKDERLVIDSAKLVELTGSDIIKGDQIIINTVKGSKSIRLLRDGIYTNILNCLGRDTSWFQLSEGDNVFTFLADEGANKLQFRIENRILFEGV